MFYLDLSCEVGNEPIADRCGHLAKIFPRVNWLIGARQEIQPLRASQRVTQSPALMEGTHSSCSPWTISVGTVIRSAGP